MVNPGTLYIYIYIYISVSPPQELVKNEVNNNVDTYTVVSAFSGAGGLDLAVRAAIPTRTICYIEREITCARVLAERASEGLLDEAPIYSDVKSFPTELFAGKVDIDFLLSGFPCQPFSVAGKQEGSEDDRNLWPDTLRLIRSLRPRYVFLENVPGLVSHEYFGTILGDLAQARYSAEWGCFTASEIGASHRRERVFILAHARCVQRSDCRGISPLAEKLQTGETNSSTPCGADELAHAESVNSEWPIPVRDGERESETPTGNRGSNLAHAEHQRYEERVQPETVGERGRQEMAHANSSGSGEDLQQAELWATGTEQSPGDSGGTESEEDEQVTRRGDGDIYRPELPEFPPGPGDPRWEWIIEHYPELAPARCKLYETEPEVRNVDDAGKIKDRVAALMMLGNAVVPQQAEHAFRTLLARIEP